YGAEVPQRLGSASSARDEALIFAIVAVAIAILGAIVFAIYALTLVARVATREASLGELVERTRRASADLAGVANELRAAVRESAAATSEQSSAVAETSATIEELAATASGIAD